MAMIIKEGYEDKKGVLYEGIRNINFEKKEDMIGNLGKFVDETEYKDNMFLSSSWNLNNGIYLYQSYFDPKIALRIYKDCADYKYITHDDAKIVKELQDRQKYVKLTDFPTGVVTIENSVVGQEIPYYANYITLAKLCENLPKDIKKVELEILKYYIEIINILKELYENDIVYADVRTRNFMINKVEGLIKLIDFESRYLSFDKKIKYDDMILNLKLMVNEVNKYFNIKFMIDKESSLENIEETLLEESYKRSR